MSSYLLIVVTAQFSLLLVAAAIFGIFFHSSLQGRLGVAYALVVIGFFLCELGVIGGGFTEALPLSLVTYFACASVVWFRWVFMLSVLNDGFRLQPLHALVLIVMITFWYAGTGFAEAGRLDVFVILRLAWFLIILCLDGHVIYSAYFLLEQDLVEIRRQFRKNFVLPLLGVMSILNLMEIASLVQNGGTFVEKNLEVVMTISLLLVIWLVIWTMAPRRADLFSGEQPQPGSVPFRPDQRIELVPELDQSNVDLLAHLSKAMLDDQVFREHGLSVSDLAAMIDARPYILRKLINQELGYRNFSSYMNQFRVRAACDELEMPELARKKMLSIALDSGYASLATFNRAFREVTGVTPTEYRRQTNTLAATNTG